MARDRSVVVSMTVDELAVVDELVSVMLSVTAAGTHGAGRDRAAVLRECVRIVALDIARTLPAREREGLYALLGAVTSFGR